MATTGCNFAKVAVTTLTGAAVKAGATTPFVEAVSGAVAGELEGNAGGTIIDRTVFDLALAAAPTVGTPATTHKVHGKYIGGYALNGALILELSGTTPQTIDLTNLATDTGVSNAGDLVFAKVNSIVFRNLGAGAVVITTGATNPADLPKLNGTSAGYTVAAGSVVAFHSNAQVTVDGSHKNIVCTPAATTELAVSIGGA